jgi:hypothetical protein
MVYGQQDDHIETRWKDYIHLRDYLVPFWQADTVYDEIIQIIKDRDLAQGGLLFNAKKILSVRSADLKKEFVRDKDWVYKDRRIVLPPGSAIPYINKNDLLFNVERPGWSMAGKTKGTFVLFSESTYFRSMQITVTYIPERNSRWKGPRPVFEKKHLPLTVAKLKTGDTVKVVFYGNSIETGANSSGFQNQSPYMPSWPQLIVYNLKEAYGPRIKFSNRSVGGKIARWGLENVSVVVDQRPDLVIIGFGMNDGSIKVPPGEYRQTIAGIIDSIRMHNPRAEFILIAPILANPDAIQSGIQALYKGELDKISGKGIVVADLTAVHQELLKHKRFQDMTGNNVNHPNDYLARWYAQFISGLLIKYN